MTWESSEFYMGLLGSSRLEEVTPELRAQPVDQPGESTDNGKKMSFQIPGAKSSLGSTGNHTLRNLECLSDEM
jgi:hypothetical protein